jgi:nicotinamide mononucleotide transporter
MEALSKIGWNQLLEVTIVILSLFYVILIALNRRSGWLFGIFASLLSVWLFIEVNLLAESILYVYYVLMGLYGYFFWKYGSADRSSPSISRCPPAFHGKIVFVSLLLTVLLAELLRYLNSANAYPDAATTVFSFVATWLAAKRVLENWIYWIIIDAFSVWLYNERGLPIYAGLMAVYSLIAVAGFIIWMKEFSRSHNMES